jgi:hypothetical protein
MGKVPGKCQHYYIPLSVSSLFSGSRDGSVMIWWDGGPAYKLLHKLQKKHKASIEEVKL